jgi:hypothetical protein
VISLFLCVLCGSPSPLHAQSFGLPLFKSKVVLQRKLPALVQLPGTTVTLAVTGHAGPADLDQDFKSQLTSELLKEDPRLSVVDHGDAVISCQILTFDHPAPTNGSRPGVQTSKGEAKPVTFLRVTGVMRVSWVARGKTGKTLGSDNAVAKFDEEYETSSGILNGGLLGLKNTFKRATGTSSDQVNPPTDAELVDAYLAHGKGMEVGIKAAEAGLWTRALEAWETLPPLPRPVDDSYRLYDVGVAYEALAYAAPDIAQATKYLDEAAINYGKAIDANPGEHYFLEPQKRIETALAHYEKLKRQQGS